MPKFGDVYIRKMDRLRPVWAMVVDPSDAVFVLHRDGTSAWQLHEIELPQEILAGKYWEKVKCTTAEPTSESKSPSSTGR